MFWKSFCLLALGFAIIAALLYAPSLRGPWQYDDYAQILDKPVLTAHTAQGFLWSAFRILPDPTDRITNRDIVRAMFRANWDWWGERPLGYRWVNLMVHVANAVLVSALAFFLLSHLSNLRYLRNLSIFSGLLFLIHPIQSQAVAYIAQRFTSMAAFFFILAVLLWLKAVRSVSARRHPLRHGVFWAWYLGAGVSAVLGSASKEIAITLPAIILLTTIAARLGWSGKSGGMVRRTLRTGLLLVPFGLLAVKIPLQVVWSSLNGRLENLQAESGGGGVIGESLSVKQTAESLTRHDYFLTEINVVRTYLRLILVPIGQSLDWDYPLTHHLDGVTAATAALHLGLVGLGVWLILKKEKGSLRIVGLGILWFYVTILPESSVVPIVDVMYEHRVYLPFVGICLAAAALAAAFRESRESHESHETHVVAVAAATVLLVILAAATMRRAYIWGDEVRLWADVWAKAPNKPRANKNYGVVLAAHQVYDRGIERLKRAVELDADNADYWSNLGTAYLRAGRYEEAAPNFQKAYDLYFAQQLIEFEGHPEDFSEKVRKQLGQYLNDYGVCMVQLNRGPEAETAFLQALDVYPGMVSARLGLGAAKNVEGDVDAAIAIFEQLIADVPELPDVYHNLTIMYRKVGRDDDARLIDLKLQKLKEDAAGQ